jgi:hypothetical protein
MLPNTINDINNIPLVQDIASVAWMSQPTSYWVFDATGHQPTEIVMAGSIVSSMIG